MAIKTHEDSEICSDCLLYLCNGDEPHDDDPQHPWDGVGNNTEWSSFSCTEEEPETYFSWRPCDNCRRPLGGDRTKGTLISYK